MQRRRFMKLGFAAAAVPTIVPRHVLGGPGHTAPSERITLGGVGIGGVGHGQIKGLAKKTRYYVQVRTYTTHGGKKFYSQWSLPKAVKTK